MSGVFPNVRGALTFAVESKDAVTATSVALGVLELEGELSTEIDGQLFIVLSALTDGGSFDVVMSAEVTMAPRAGASCTEGGTRTQRDEHEVS